MKYRYRWLDQMVDQIEGATDPAIKMAVIWANRDDKNLRALLNLLYDYRYTVEIAKLPEYRKISSPGLDPHVAITHLVNKLDQNIIGASQKFEIVKDILKQLQDRDAEVLARALTGDLDLGIPPEDIKRAYPDMKVMAPGFAKNVKEKTKFSDLRFPGTIVRQNPDLPEIRIVTYEQNFKFVDQDGKAMVLPDKPKSSFASLARLKNVVLSCELLAKTKDGRISNAGAAWKVYESLQKGELKSENFSVRILDAVDRTSYEIVPEALTRHNLTFTTRRSWIENQKWNPDFVMLAEKIDLPNEESLRQQEDALYSTKDLLRFYQNQNFFKNGFVVFDQKSF